MIATALNYVNGPSFGLGILVGTSGADVMTAHGLGNLIIGNGGNDIINAGSGLAGVMLGNGNASVVLGGGLNSVIGGSGNVSGLSTSEPACEMRTFGQAKSGLSTSK